MDTNNNNNKASYVLSGSILVAALLIAGSVFYSRGLGVSDKADVGGGTGSDPKDAPDNLITKIDMDVLTDDDAVRGDKNAPVTMVEFSDYECPFCERHFTQTHPQIIKEYVDTGKVKIVFRDFPLPFHPNAQKAAEAAECAGEQDKYWEMHDKLFQNQSALGIDKLKQYAKDLGLDASKFNQCLDSGAMASEVKKDAEDGSAVGINGTPGFIINGTLVSGAQPFSAFKTVIDAALKN